jgi:hypothetical protein
MNRSDELAMAIAPVAALVPSALMLGDKTRSLMLLGIPVSYLVALLIGWPLLALLRRRGWARPWTLTLAGTALASPFAALSSLLGWRPVVGVLLAGAVGGGLVWMLAVGPTSSSSARRLGDSA